MVDRRKVFSDISSWDHCQRSSPSRISAVLQGGFELMQSSGFVELSCAVVISNTPWHNIRCQVKSGVFALVLIHMHVQRNKSY